MRCDAQCCRKLNNCTRFSFSFFFFLFPLFFCYCAACLFSHAALDSHGRPLDGLLRAAERVVGGDDRGNWAELNWAKGNVLNHDNWINLHVNSGLAQTKKRSKQERERERQLEKEREREMALANQANYIKNYAEMISWESARQSKHRAKANGEKQLTHTCAHTHTQTHIDTFSHTLRTCAPKTWFQIAFAA